MEILHNFDAKNYEKDSQKPMYFTENLHSENGL